MNLLSVALWLATKKKNVSSEECCSVQQASSYYMILHTAPLSASWGQQHTEMIIILCCFQIPIKHLNAPTFISAPLGY